MENTTETPENVKSYFFTFAFKIAGLLDSDMSEEDTRNKLLADLEFVYGPGGVEITDFHEASEDELARYQEYLKESENPTIN